MTDISFYHLQQSSLEGALPKLLEHALEAGKRALVRVGSAELIEPISSALWTKRSESWIPHGFANDGYAKHQPVWLTSGLDNPNRATFIFLVGGVEASDVTKFERCFDLFDGSDSVSVEEARKRWKILKEAGHQLKYWQENQLGKWQEKSQ